MPARARADRQGRSPPRRSRAPRPAPSRLPPTPARRESPAARLDDQVTAGQGPPSLFEKPDVAEPPAIRPPSLLEPNGGCQPLFDGAKRPDLALDLEVLDHESRPLEQRPRPGLIVSEARGPSGLDPLVVMERHEGERLAGLERPAGPLGDRIRHAEVGDDERR